MERREKILTDKLKSMLTDLVHDKENSNVFKPKKTVASNNNLLKFAMKNWVENTYSLVAASNGDQNVDHIDGTNEIIKLAKSHMFDGK